MTLPTRSLGATRAFYQQLLGRTLTVTEAGALALGEHLLFVEVPASKQTWTPDAQVTIHVDDTTDLAARLRGARERTDGSVLVTDPDGRLVVIAPSANS